LELTHNFAATRIVKAYATFYKMIT
jgi:hypothetical protein